MSIKRPIDVQREAALSVEIGGDDKSKIEDAISTGKNLYVLKANGVYKVQLADNIDPARTNPNVPNTNQQVLTAGCDNEIVGRVLLTAKYLFDEHNADVKPFNSSILESCVLLTKQILELDAMSKDLTQEIDQKHRDFAENIPKHNAFILPSIPSLETKTHNILLKADKIKDAILSICTLHFLPDVLGRPKLDQLNNAVFEAIGEHDQLVIAWNGISEYFSLLRNARNACEHPKKNHEVVLNDFKMFPDGVVYQPIFELHHPDTPIRSIPLIEFLSFIRNSVLDYAEGILTFVRWAMLQKNNPFNEGVVEFPPEQRRNKFVKFYRAINIGGQYQILG